MNLRRIELALFGMLVLALGSAGGKAEPATNAPPASQPAPAPSGETVARLHWIGQKRVVAETTSTNLPSIWNLPASKQLAAHVLDRLSAAPWRLAHGNAALTNAATLTNAAAAQFRPLLEDLVSEESFLEVREGTNQTGELAFAIRLSEERARLWETNLAAMLEALTRQRPVPTTGDRRGWSLKQSQSPKLIELTRAGQWIVVGAAQERNTLLGERLARIQRDRAPVAPSPSNAWVEADFDLRRVAGAMSLGWKLPADWPRISFTLSGDREDVLTRGTLNFARPLPFELEPWNIPTNFIHDPLDGFTAIRGLGTSLSSLKIWNDLRLGVPPKQLYLWALNGNPLQTYCLAALPDAAKPLNQITSWLTNEGNVWLAKNGMGKFQQASNGVTGWVEIPFMSPRLEVVKEDNSQYLLGGFLPLFPATNTLPAELLRAVMNPTNLVLYDWEITGPRMAGWMYIGQTTRFLAGKPQLPIASASLGWLKAAGTKLSNCVTVLSRTGANQLTLVRRSSFGFSAFELHLLAEWLESPRFPCGLHSLDASADETSIHADLPAGSRPP